MLEGKRKAAQAASLLKRAEAFVARAAPGARGAKRAQSLQEEILDFLNRIR
jgi:hypothetical protein